MKNKTKFKRRNYLIAKVYQWRFAGRILFFMAIVSVIVIATVYFTGWALLKEKLYSYYSNEMLSQVFWEMNVLLLFRFLLIVPLVILLAIVLSHRIVGPIYRIKKVLDKVAKGDFGLRIRLRRSDELKDLAETINNALESMENKDKISQLQKGTEEDRRS